LELAYCLPNENFQDNVFCLRLGQSIIKLHNLISMGFAIGISDFDSLGQILNVIEDTFGPD
jgi:hypothetical protein